MRTPVAACLVLALGMLGACAGKESRPAASPAAPTPTPAVSVPDLEIRALLLLLVDRQIYEPFTVERALGEGAEVRRELAASLGRIPDARAVPVLVALLGDTSVEVRREAAFALGRHREGTATPALLRAAAGADFETGRLAVESLGVRGAALSEVRAALDALPEDEVRRRLLPALFRFDEPGLVDGARDALETGDPDLGRLAMVALGRNPRPEAVPLLREGLGSDDPRVRAWAARGLGGVGDGSDLERLLPLLGDPGEDPVVQALRTGSRLVASGAAGASDPWRREILRLVDDPRVGVRVTALEAAGAWLLDEQLGARLLERARSGPARERELAFLSLVAGEDPRGRDLLPELARDPDPVLRAAAVRGAAAWGQQEILRELAADPDPRVRVAVLQERLEETSAEGDAALVPLGAGLEDADPVVRAVALGRLAEHPLLPYEALVLAFQRAGDDRPPDARLAAIDALAARAGEEPRERGAVVTALEEILRYPEFLVRRAAAEALAGLGRPAASPGPATEMFGIEAYRERVLRSRAERRVRMETSKGAVELVLDCPAAPLTCLNFLSLAGQGFYDGLVFHRVVPGFVVQGGDPRGTGWGGPGYAIRDEPNRIEFDRGVIGMATSGPDTAGSQFFVTLAPQPHLDGGYTAFGRVTAGSEVLESILQGDEIRTIREVGAPVQPLPRTPRR